MEEEKIPVDINEFRDMYERLYLKVFPLDKRIEFAFGGLNLEEELNNAKNIYEG